MIYLDKSSDQTICVCDRCGTTTATNAANGVVVEGWMTGHLWIDISLSEQKQTPLCFCPECTPTMVGAQTIQVSASNVTLPEAVPVSIEERRAKATMDKVELLVALLFSETITLEEFKQASEGEIPERMAGALESLPETEQAIARAKWKNDVVISRMNPVIIEAAGTLGLSPEQLDQVFGLV